MGQILPSAMCVQILLKSMGIPSVHLKREKLLAHVVKSKVIICFIHPFVLLQFILPVYSDQRVSEVHLSSEWVYDGDIHYSI